MKKVKFIAFILATVAIVPSLQSCLGDSDRPAQSMVISTINVINADSGEFDFTLDNGKKMFPSHTGEMGGYELTDGQRAFVVFNQLDEKVEGYDYNIEVKRIENVLTKEVVTLGEGENTEERMGDDKINATYMWITKDAKFLTIEFQYLGTHDENNRHLLNLVVNPATEATPADDYLDLEFRHNKQGDMLTHLGEGYVSFNLNKIKELAHSKKGLRIRVNTLYEGVKYYTKDFATD